MANPKMKEAGYEYGDEDVNAVVAVVRQKIKSSENAGSIFILNAVAGQGVEEGDARNLEWNLNKHSRLKETEFLTILHRLRTLDTIELDAVNPVMESEYLGTNVEITAAVYDKLKELAYNKAALEHYVSSEAVKAMGRDVFDEIAEPLKKDKKIKVLFPLNVGDFHWVLGELEIEKKANNIVIKLHKRDPMGGGEFTEKEIEQLRTPIENRLKDIFPGQVINVTIEKPKNEIPRRQAEGDGTSCGVIVCDTLSAYAENKPVGGPVPKGALELRQQQYNLVSGPKVETKLPLGKAADKKGKWNDHSVQKVKEAFDEVFKGVKAELVDDTIKTTDLSDDNLKALVEKTKALMDQLGLKGTVEINVSPETKRSRLEELCREHKLEFTSNAKEEAPAEVPAGTPRLGG